MKDEIKEILKQCDGVVKREIPLLILAPEYTQLLLDYITNLQDRIDKAIEKLKYYSGGEADYYVPFEVIINLLQGKSDE